MLEQQWVVRLGENPQKTIDWLEANGFENFHKLTAETCKLGVVVVEGMCFFATNVTCMAARATCGLPRPITLEQFQEMMKHRYPVRFRLED